MNIEELNSLIGSDAYWQVNKKIARFFKDNNTAVLLSDLISKQNYFEKRKETVYGGFFYNTAENIEKDCNISYHKQKGCLKQLTDAGFLETIRKGLPAKLHFKINPNQIFNFLNTSIEKTNNQDDQNFKTNNNKLNKNKEITINNKDEFFEKNSPETKTSDLSNNHQKEKRKKVAPKKEKDQSLHQIIIDVYFDWFKQRNDGVPPKIDAAEAKAAKMIAEYFKTIQAKKEPNTTEEEMPEKIKNMALYIFSKWDTLEAFLQKQVKLTQINSNITNIINFIKNGKQATNNNYNKQPVTDDTIAERFKYFSEFFDRE